MRQIQDQALVLNCRDYRENDRLARLFTLEHGPLTALARGAKRSMKRFGGALEPCARIAVDLTPSADEGLSILHGASPLAPHPLLARDLERFARASYACELVDRLIPERLPNPRLYRLLSAYLDHLGDGGDPHAPTIEGARRFFEMNLLNIIGYRPDLAAPLAAGLLSPGSAAALQRCLKTGRFGAVAFGPDELAEAGALLDRAILSHLDRPPRSLEFLREIGAMQND